MTYLLYKENNINCIYERWTFQNVWSSVVVLNLKMQMKTTSVATSKLKIALSVPTGYVFLRPEEIISIQSDGNTTTANILGSRQIRLKSLLKQVEHDLPACFFRSHKSHIINLNYMYEYNIKEKYIVMEDQSVIPLSRRKVAAFNEFIGRNAFVGSNWWSCRYLCKSNDYK